MKGASEIGIMSKPQSIINLIQLAPCPTMPAGHAVLEYLTRIKIHHHTSHHFECPRESPRCLTVVWREVVLSNYHLARRKTIIAVTTTTTTTLETAYNSETNRSEVSLSRLILPKEISLSVELAIRMLSDPPSLTERVTSRSFSQCA